MDVDQFSDFVNQQASAARSAAVGGIDANPDQAARAVQLGSATGVPALVINNDVPGFEAQHKAALASTIIGNNPDLQNYVNSNPMAAKVSNDDWGALDKVTQSGGWLSSFRSFMQAHDPVYQGLSGALEGAEEGFGDQPIGSELDQTKLPELAKLAIHPILDPIELGLRLLSAGFSGTVGGITGAASAIGGDSFGRDIGAMFEKHMLEAGQADTGVHPALEAAKPWLQAGMDVPVGVHPAIDSFRAEVNARAVDSLFETLQSSQDAATRERSGEMYQRFVENVKGDGSIAVPGDVVAKLYEGKEPAPDDGILGWVPNIQDQLALARETGDRVHIPEADFHTYIDPAMANELKPYIEMWPGGVSANDAAELALKQPPAVVDSPMAQTRAAMGTEPAFAIGDRKLTLSPVESGTTDFHDFQMLDDTGKHIGDLEIMPIPKAKELYVANINGLAGHWANTFGPSLMLDLKRQLKALYPGYEYLSGDHVTGARYESGAYDRGQTRVRVALSAPDISTEDFQASRGILNDAYWRKAYPGIEANIRPTNEFRQSELPIIQAVNEELQKMVGKQGAAIPTDAMQYHRLGVAPEGMFIPSTATRKAFALFDLFAKDSVGTIRHEGVHWLRREGMIKPEEWKVLDQAAKDEGWLDKYRINERYSDSRFTYEDRLEEAVAEAYRDWAGKKDIEPFTTPYTGIFEKLSQLWENIKGRLSQIFGREPSWQDMFQQIGEGKFSDRPTVVEGRDAAPAFSIDERDNIQASTMGLDIKSYKAWRNALDEKYHVDLEAARARALKEQTRQQSATWKADREATSKEVRESVSRRPAVAADMFIGAGELKGEKLQQRFTLRADDLSEEQKAALPDHYVSAHGLPIDPTAKLFGYQSGDDMVRDLAQYNAAKAGLSPTEMRDKIIDAETDQRMEAEHGGGLKNNIMREAQDQAFGEADQNYIAEELQFAAVKAKSPKIDMNVVANEAREQFGEKLLRNVDTQSQIRELNHNGDLASRAGVAGKWDEMARWMQRKTMSFMLAKDAAQLDKERLGFEKTKNRMKKKEVPSIDPEYHNWIQDIYQRLGIKTSRNLLSISSDIAARSSQTLTDFAAERNALSGREINIPEFLQNPKWSKPLKDLSVNEFRDIHNLIETLVDNGRDEQKINIGGQAKDLAEFKKGLIAEASDGRAVKIYGPEARKGAIGAVGRFLRVSQASHIDVVDLMDRFSHWDPKGYWAQSVRDLARGAQDEEKFIKKYAEKLRTAWKSAPVQLDKDVTNDIFRHPTQGYMIPNFTRGHLIKVMLDLGTNLDIMAGGWKLKPEQILDWVNRNAKEEDWNFVQKIWGVFGDAKKESDTMYRSIGTHGVSVVPTRSIETPFGIKQGMYFPAIRHEEFAPMPRALKDSLFQDNYNKATPLANYTKSRTGAQYPLSFSLDAIAPRLMQQIHDAATRPALIQASKIFLDKDIQGVIKDHFNNELAHLLPDWLKDIANTANYRAEMQQEMDSLLGTLRSNIIGTVVGAGTFLKHTPTAFKSSITELGGDHPAIRFWAEVANLLTKNPETGERNYKFAWNNSNELPRRAWNAQETVYGAVRNITRPNAYVTLRDTIRRIGSFPYLLGDLVSAVPLWLAKYKELRLAGEDHGSAVYQADRAVQRAHGSTLMTNQPAVVRHSNPWFTGLYNFYSNYVNRQMEIVWRAGERTGGANPKLYDSGMDKVKDLVGRTFTYAIWPAIVAQMVSPWGTNQNPWWEKAGVSLGTELAGGWIGVRDLAAMIKGDSPELGLMGTAARFAYQPFRDIAERIQKGSNPIRDRALVRDSVNLSGLLTGIPPGIANPALTFEAGRALNIEHPRGPWSWMVGERYGTLRNHSSTFQNYLAGKPF